MLLAVDYRFQLITQRGPGLLLFPIHYYCVSLVESFSDVAVDAVLGYAVAVLAVEFGFDVLAKVEFGSLLHNRNIPHSFFFPTFDLWQLVQVLLCLGLDDLAAFIFDMDYVWEQASLKS